MLVAVLNSKGGVGKSTVAAHAALWLHDRGIRVAVVDADAQASTSEWLAVAAPRIRLERCDNVAALQDRLPRLTAIHAVVIADGPAALSPETAVLAAAADIVLLPIGPSMMDIWASYRTARLLYRLRLRGPRPDRPRVWTVLNRVQPRTRLVRVAVEAVQRYGFPVAATPLRLRTAYAEACGARSAVWRMGPAARDAALEIDRLFEEVLAPVVAAETPAAVPATAVTLPLTAVAAPQAVAHAAPADPPRAPASPPPATSGATASKPARSAPATSETTVSEPER